MKRGKVLSVIMVLVMVVAMALPVITYAKSTKITKVTGFKVTSVLDGNNANVTLEWKKIKGVSGYEVAYTGDGEVKKTVYSGKKTSVIKSFAQGEEYTFFVRAYIVKNGKKIYGKIVSKKIKTAISNKVAEDIVAQLGGEEYATAINGVVTLLKDVTISSEKPISLNGGTVSIDLNGNRLISSEKANDFTIPTHNGNRLSHSYPAIIELNGKDNRLFISDSLHANREVSEYNWGGIFAKSGSSGKVVIDSGEFILVNSASAKMDFCINGGYFDTLSGKGTWVINGGVFYDRVMMWKAKSVEITGGDFSKSGYVQIFEGYDIYRGIELAAESNVRISGGRFGKIHIVDYIEGNMNIQITGGTFEPEDSMGSICIELSDKNAIPSENLIETLVPEGYEIKYDKTFSVAKIPNAIAFGPNIEIIKK